MGGGMTEKKKEKQKEEENPPPPPVSAVYFPFLQTRRALCRLQPFTRR